jgi:hypothetical protein
MIFLCAMVDWFVTGHECSKSCPCTLTDMTAKCPRLMLSPEPESPPPVKRQFTAWDQGLEAMLSRPISPDLALGTVRWQDRALKNADARFDTSLGVRPKGPTCVVMPNARERELMLARVISAPLSPRKPSSAPKTLSTNTTKKRNSDFHDHRRIEEVVHRRQERASRFAVMQPRRKADIPAVARRVDLVIDPALLNAFWRTNGAFR